MIGHLQSREYKMLIIPINLYLLKFTTSNAFELFSNDVGTRISNFLNAFCEKWQQAQNNPKEKKDCWFRNATNLYDEYD